MQPNLINPSSAALGAALTQHAAVRMQQRCISPLAVDAAIAYGRHICAKGVTFCVIGRKEVAHYAKLGINLSEAEGVQVLLSSDGAVVTAYRSRNLHAIKVSSRRSRSHRQH